MVSCSEEPGGGGLAFTAFPPRPELSGLIQPILVMGLDGCSSALPATLSPGILVMARGGLSLPGVGPLPRACLCGPTMEPRVSRACPGTVSISLMFTPGCLDSALGPGVHEFRGQILPLEQFFGEGPVARLLEQVDEQASPAAWVAALQGLVLERLRQDALARAYGQWRLSRGGLFLPLERMAKELGLGERQLERRVKRSFGLNIRDLRRTTRFGFALAALCAGRARGRGGVARLAQDYGYYDLAHMDRDFQALAGLSPSGILAAAAGDDPAYWLYRFRSGDFQALFLPDDVASIQSSLFPGT